MHRRIKKKGRLNRVENRKKLPCISLISSSLSSVELFYVDELMLITYVNYEAYEHCISIVWNQETRLVP